MVVTLLNYPIRSEHNFTWYCLYVVVMVIRAESNFKEMMDEPLLRMAISRGNQYAVSGEGSDVSDYHHGDGDSTVDGMVSYAVVMATQ